VRAAILLYHDVLELDAAGPNTVLRTAARYAPDGIEFDVFTVARSRASVVTAGGLVITPGYAYASAPEPDALLVPGGPGAVKAGRDPATRAYLRDLAGRLRFLASVSTGALALGEAGLLEGLSVTTWRPQLESLWAYGPAEVLEDRVVRNPGGRLFAGGPAAGLDLALEIVADALGQEVANRTAEHLGYPFWAPLPNS
jgi:cyclohexyl-isocyanide hydratase